MLDSQVGQEPCVSGNYVSDKDPIQIQKIYLNCRISYNLF